MRQFFFYLLVSAVLCLVGCTPVEVKEKSHEQRVLVGAYLPLLADGKTTREQDAAVIKECYKTFLIFDWGLNDDEEAKKILEGETK